MRIALTHNLRLTDSVEEAEFDTPETIDAIVAALKADGHEVDRLDVTGPASRVVARLEAFAPDLIFNTAEGKRGRVRRAFYPLLFEELGFPYTGSDAYVLAVTLDKNLTKKLLLAHGVPAPLGRLMTLASLHAGALDDLVYPVICKPNYEGSSKGIGANAVAEDPVQLARLVEELAPIYTDVLVERYIPGVDVVVGFLEGGPNGGILEPMEHVIDAAYPRRYDVFDFELKHHQQHFVTYRIPSELPAQQIQRVRQLAERVVAALDLRDTATMDFRVARDGEIYFLSATALPTLQPDAHLALAAIQAGITYEQFIQRLVRTAARRAGIEVTRSKSTNARKRPGLRVGLAFNLKRTDTELDDTEAEYDSPRTIESISRAIESHGHQVVLLEANQDFPRAIMTSGVELVFNIAEGIRGRNREAQVPSLCELLGIPYTGSDSATLSLCLDKGLAKRILAQHEIDTPAWQVMVTGKEKLKPFRFPVIVKPNAEGTSKGITDKSVVDDEAGVRTAARALIDRYRQPALVEEYIVGREFTVGLLGEKRPRILPPMEVIFLKQKDRPVYDFTCKQDWEQHVRYECPANVTKEELKQIEKVCRATFMALDCRDVARVDLRLTPDGKVYVIEVNPLPGLTPDYSDLCLIANGAKIDYRTLIGEILSGGLKRCRESREARGETTPVTNGVTNGTAPLPANPPQVTSSVQTPPAEMPPPVAAVANGNGSTAKPS